MRSIITAFATSLVLGASILVGAPMASAEAGSVTVTPPADTQLFDDVTSLPYTYALSLPPNNLWNVRVTLTRPNGTVIEASDFLFDGHDDVAGTGSLNFYNDYKMVAGTYTMTAYLDWREPTGETHVELPVTAQFTVFRRSSKTTMTVSTKRPHYNGTVVFKTRSLLQQPVGYRQYPYARVRLQGYRHGWKTLTSAKTFGSGRATFRFTWHTHQRRIKVRVETLRDGLLIESSTSAPVTIRVR